MVYYRHRILILKEDKILQKINKIKINKSQNYLRSRSSGKNKNSRKRKLNN